MDIPNDLEPVHSGIPDDLEPVASAAHQPHIGNIPLDLQPVEMVTHDLGGMDLTPRVNPFDNAARAVAKGLPESLMTLGHGLESISRMNPMLPAAWMPPVITPQRVQAGTQAIERAIPTAPGASETTGRIIGGAIPALAATAIAGPEAAVPIFAGTGAAQGAAGAEDAAMHARETGVNVSPAREQLAKVAGAGLGFGSGYVGGSLMEGAGQIAGGPVSRVAMQAALGPHQALSENLERNVTGKIVNPDQPWQDISGKDVAQATATNAAFALGGELHQAMAGRSTAPTDIPTDLEPVQAAPPDQKVATKNAEIPAADSRAAPIQDEAAPPRAQIQESASPPAVEPIQRESSPPTVPQDIPADLVPVDAQESNAAAPIPHVTGESGATGKTQDVASGKAFTVGKVDQPAPVKAPKQIDTETQPTRLSPKELDLQLRNQVMTHFGPDAADLGSHPMAAAAWRGEEPPGRLISAAHARDLAATLPEDHPARITLHNITEFEKNPAGTRVKTINTNDAQDGQRVQVNDKETLTIDKEDGVIRDGITSPIPDGGLNLYGKKILPPHEDTTAISDEHFAPADVHDSMVKAGVSHDAATESVKKLIAWHGSKHDFEQFDSSKIGTGEGAQAYGHGLYFAGKSEVAEHYRTAGLANDARGRAAISIDGKDVPDDWGKIQDFAAGDGNTADAIRSLQQSGGDFGIAERSLRSVLDKSTAENNVNALNALRGRVKVVAPKPKGNLYQTELAPREDELLDWDKPLSEQSETVKKALENSGVKIAPEKGFRIEQTKGGRDFVVVDGRYEYDRFRTREAAEAKVAELERSYATKGKQMYEELAHRLGTTAGENLPEWMRGEKLSSDEAASKYLHSLGIRGIKYMDQQSRSAGEGSRNYVIFNDKDVTITHKNDQPVGASNATAQGNQPGNLPKERGPVEESQRPSARGSGPDRAAPAPQEFSDQSEKGVFGQPVITSAGIGQQQGMFHEPVKVEVPREKPVGSKSANAPENTGEMFKDLNVTARAGRAKPSPAPAAAEPETQSIRDRVAEVTTHIVDSAKRLSGNLFPSVSRYSEASGEKLSRYIASRAYVKEAAPAIASEVLGDNPELDAKAGAVLAQDNLDSIRKGFLDKATSATDPEERQAAIDAAGKVNDIIGADNSPLKSRADFEDALADPKIKGIIDRYKKWFASEADPNFRTAQDIAPDEDMPTRGERTQARVNLRAINDTTEQTPTTIVTARRGSLSNPLKKRSAFARQAFGTGEAYETSLSKMIENTLGKGDEIARQREAYDQLVKDGLAVYGKPGQSPTLGGKPTVGYDIKRTTLVREGGKMVPLNQKIYVRADVAPEVRQALAVDSPRHSASLSRIANVANKAALTGLTEASYHARNQLLTVLKTPGVGIREFVQNSWGMLTKDPQTQRRLVDLARIGALREKSAPLEGAQRYNPLQWISKGVETTDRVGRLMMDSAFKKLPAYKDTETNRRDFINQFGQYNKRGQHRMIALARDTGLGPFATAGSNFYMIKLKSLALSPGAEATSASAAIQLRARVFARYAVTVGAVCLANYLKWGRVDGGNNVPIGAIRLDDDKDGKIRYWDALGNLTPLKGGMRETGLEAVRKGVVSGSSPGEVTDAAWKDIRTSAMHPTVGPLPESLMILGTGSGLGDYEKAKKAPVGQSQFKENAKAAATNFNPIIGGVAKELQGDGSFSDSQLGPFSVHTGGKERSVALNRAKAIAGQRAGDMRLTDEQQQRHDARRDLIDQYRKNPQEGMAAIRQAVRDGKIPADQIGEIARQSKRSDLLNTVWDMPADAVLEVYKLGTPDEQKELAPVIRQKIARAREPVAKKQEWMRQLK